MSSLVLQGEQLYILNKDKTHLFPVLSSFLPASPFQPSFYFINCTYLPRNLFFHTFPHYTFLLSSLLLLFSPLFPAHLSHLVLLLFHKWRLLFSISLSHSSSPFFLCSLLLLAQHSKLSRVANHYPQSQALNQRIFTLSIMCSPSHSVSFSPSRCLSPLKPPPISLYDLMTCYPCLS